MINVMDHIIQTAKEYILLEKQQGVAEKCTNYIKEHPDKVAKGAIVGLVAYYTIPVALGVISWLPYVGVGVYLYRKGYKVSSDLSTVQKATVWYQWGKSWF